MLDSYEQLLAGKNVAFEPSGIDAIPDLHAGMFPHQRAVTEFLLRVGRGAAFLDCVAGETLIETIHGPARIDDLARRGLPIMVYSLGPDGLPRTSAATVPFRKGCARLYTVMTATGRSISVTAKHRFLTERGWVSCDRLAVGERLLVSDACRPHSTEGNALSASRQDVHRSSQIREGSTDDYCLSRRRGDQQPRLAKDICQATAQPRGDVRAPVHLWSHEGGLARKPGHSRHHHNSDHPSTKGSVGRDCSRPGVLECQPLSCGSEPSASSNDTCELSRSAEHLPPSSVEHHPYPFGSLAAVQSSPWSTPHFDEVVSIQYLRTDDYYDLHVPGDENYLAHGFWNHNTGLGKTLVALEWGRVVMEKTGRPVLMLVPLAVAHQHQREAEAFGIDARAVREESEVGLRINITNYERLPKFDASRFEGIILDESSILKSFAGATTRKLIETFCRTPYRLACTATPAPNDYTEMGQHSEFLGTMPAQEMLMRWFINDTATASQKWRLKGHAAQAFWDWVATWARCVSKPSDIGFSDEGFALPELNMQRHVVEADRNVEAGDALFRMPDVSATSIHREKRLTINERADVVAGLTAHEASEPWVVWCDTDYEADALKKRIPDAVEVRGSMKPEDKEARLVAFSEGKERVIITKPSIAGFGLNWQHCADVAFAGLSFSYESFYQAVRRCWRFGQRRRVNVHVAMADTERSIWEVVTRKQGDHDAMKQEMHDAMKRASQADGLMASHRPTRNVELPAWLRGAA